MANKHTRYDKRDARVLMNNGIGDQLAEIPSANFDSAEDASVFFARELDYIKSKTYDKEYPEHTALNLFPISHEVDEGAEFVTYYTYEKQGFAKIVDNYSDDPPRVDASGKPTTVKIETVADSYGYSIQEMAASRYAKKSLDARKAEAARYVMDNTLNKIAWAGDADHGILGVLSTAQQIPLYSVPNGAGGATTWKSKTADEILADISGMLAQVAATTNNVERPDTLCIPADVYINISTRRIPDTGITVLKFLQDNFTQIKNFVSVAELGSTNTFTNPYASQSKGVALLFTNNDEKLSLEIPLPFKQYVAQIKNFETVVPCRARTAGVIVYYPLSAIIAVGI